MPKILSKPTVDPKPPCGGCDVCGDLREDGLYALDRNGKHHCHKCFHKVAQNWPKPMQGQSIEDGKNIWVEISEEWYEKAVECGTARFEQAMRKGLRRDAGLPGENDNQAAMLADHILGAAGEVAWAKLSRQAWKRQVNNFSHGGDVNQDQVRTRSVDWYDLNIKQKDLKAHPNSDFVLLIGKHGSRKFRAVGWINCKDAIKDEWIKSPGGGKPGWFVPQSALLPITRKIKI